MFKVYPWQYTGTCLYLTISECVKKAGVMRLSMHFSEEVLVYIHHENQGFDLDSASLVKSLKGMNTRIFVNHQVLIQKKNCINNPKFNYDDCILNKVSDLMINKVGCTVPWVLN